MRDFSFILSLQEEEVILQVCVYLFSPFSISYGPTKRSLTVVGFSYLCRSPFVGKLKVDWIEGFSGNRV